MGHMTLGEIEDISTGAGHDQPEVAGPRPRLGEGELHFVATVEGIVDTNDGEHGVIEEGCDFVFFEFKLLGVSEMLKGAAAANGRVGAAGLDAMGRCGEEF